MFERLHRRLKHYEPPAPDAWAALTAAFGPPRAYDANDEILAQFSRPGSSTLLLSGVAARVVQLRGGDQQVTALHLPGDFIDLHSLLLARLDHSVSALAPCVVASIPHGDLTLVTEAHPRLARALWFVTVVDAAIHRQWLTVVGRRPASGRAAHMVCELYLRFEDIGLAQSHRFELGLTQATFGDILCITTVHANRTIQRLRQAGLLEWSQGVVEILDWDGLARVGEFDPTYLQLGGPKVPN